MAGHLDPSVNYLHSLTMVEGFRDVGRLLGKVTKVSNDFLVPSYLVLAMKRIASVLPPGVVVDAWLGLDFQPVPEMDGYDPRDGETAFSAYADNVNWADVSETHRALMVFEDICFEAFEDINDDPSYDFAQSSIKKLTRFASRAGFSFDQDTYRFTLPDTISLSEEALVAIEDPQVLQDQVDLLNTLLSENHPDVVVTVARALCESAAKIAAARTGIELTGRENFPKLVNLVSEKLQLDAGGVDKDIDSDKAVREMLGGASKMMNGLAEFRNRFGIDHGRTTASPLKTRHAQVAVDAAQLWCNMILSTLGDPEANWKKRPRSSQTVSPTS